MIRQVGDEVLAMIEPQDFKALLIIDMRMAGIIQPGQKP